MSARPPRLDRVFQDFDAPLWFVTFNTRKRRKLLATESVHSRFREFGINAARKHVSVGRYVLMPDHVHFFVRGSEEFDLKAWVRLLKLALSGAIDGNRPHWQEGFFDHLLRSVESYSEKWEYVAENPVRAGLVETAKEWPYQGEVSALPFD